MYAHNFFNPMNHFNAHSHHTQRIKMVSTPNALPHLLSLHDPPIQGANLRGEALSCDQPSTSSVSSSFLAVLSGVLTPYLPLLKQGILGLPSEGDSHQNCWNLFSIAQVSTPLKPAKTWFGQGQTAVIIHPKKYGWGPQFAQHQDLHGIHLI